MAGQKATIGKTKMGLPLVTITENVEPDDEWGLFRLTDDGLGFYEEGAEFAANIMSMKIAGKSTVKEIARRTTKEEAIAVRDDLPKEERKRTLIRPVRPKKGK